MNIYRANAAENNAVRSYNTLMKGIPSAGVAAAPAGIAGLGAGVLGFGAMAMAGLSSVNAEIQLQNAQTQLQIANAMAPSVDKMIKDNIQRTFGYA